MNAPQFVSFWDKDGYWIQEKGYPKERLLVDRKIWTGIECPQCDEETDELHTSHLLNQEVCFECYLNHDKGTAQ